MTDPNQWKAPPETPDGWETIHRGADYAHRMWAVLGPIVEFIGQFVRNRKWWSVVIAVAAASLAVTNSETLAQTVMRIIGAGL